MSNGGFFEQKNSSPTGLVIVVAAHAAAIAALALSKMDVPGFVKPDPTTIYNVPITQDPPPIPDEPIKQEVKPQHRSVIETPRREVVTKTPTAPVFASDEMVKPVYSEGVIGEVDIPTPPTLPPAPPQTIPDPVRTLAKLKPGIELLPPYPASEERAEIEGSVTVRLLIGADGRVKSAERVAAANDAFWRATERHAIKAWRFTPATVDGRPVESRTTVTVKFELKG